jgi:hypothetical protein
VNRPVVLADRGPGPIGIGRFGTSALVGFVVLGAMFSSRFGVSLPDFNSDISIVTIMAPLVAIATIVRAGPSRTLGFLHNSAFIFLVGPYLALMVVLPWLGVFFNGYEVRTLYALTNVTTWFSFLVIGAAVSGAGLSAWSSWLVVAVVLQCLYALAQAASLGAGPLADVLRPVVEWDYATASDSYLIRARSSGLFTNPNVLGFWAAMATMLAFTVVSPRVRPFALALALLTLVLSQSRGAAVALLFTCGAGIIGALFLGRIPRSQLRGLAGALLLLVVVAPVVVIVLPTQTADRFEALVNVFTQGVAADQNLAGRIDYWAAVTDLNMQEYPLGTWGPPEGLLGTAVDSDWFRAFAQGSIVLVFANMLLLLAPLGVGSYPGRYALVLLAIIIAIAGITQTSLTYPPALLYCALLGSGLQWAVENRRLRVSRGNPRVRAIDRRHGR